MPPTATRGINAKLSFYIGLFDVTGAISEQVPELLLRMHSNIVDLVLDVALL